MPCALVALTFAIDGCSYYSTSSRTAKDIKSIAVPFFDNRTSEPNVEIEITNRIITNLLADNTLRVVDERDADAVLEGVVRSYENRPFSFNRDLNAEEYHVVVSVEATLFSRKTNEAIWQDKQFRGDGSYFIDATEDDRTEDDAFDEAIKEITDQILNLTVQDW